MPLSVRAGSKTLVVPDHYATIEAAIENATDGDTIFVKAGTYEENPLKINKPISLIGEGAETTKISFDPPYTEEVYNILEHYKFYENPIEVHADGFKLSGFNITTIGGYMGISGNRTKITGNKISVPLGIGGFYVDISKNTFSRGVSLNGTYCKIYSNNFIGSLSATGQFNIISLNSFIGGTISVEGSFFLVNGNKVTNAEASTFKVSGNYNDISENVIDNVGIGLAVVGSNNTVYANRVTHCGVGLSPQSGNIFYANYIANNLWGIDTGYKSTAATLSHNNFIRNTYQVSTLYNSYPPDHFDNGKEGNYWSDYVGVDADGDGIGDTPYVVDDNRSDRYPLIEIFDIDSVTVELPEWASTPTLHIISPENATYPSENVTLNFAVNKQTPWTGYSLDGQENVTVTVNTTMTGLCSGSHNVTVYARDEVGNVGVSQTVWFSVAEPFPVIPVAAASSVVIILAGAGLTLYFKKHKKNTANS
jgi:nitrous oxidase accessory protein